MRQTAARGLSVRSGFYGNAPDRPCDDVLGDYLRFLEQRNGPLRDDGVFARREAWLDDTRGWSARHASELDAATFADRYERLGDASSLDPAMLALLAFVKVNASEAYGVEVITRLRFTEEATTLFERVERVLTREERYHTRILVGAARQFSLPEPSGAWKPPLALRLLIGTLAHVPRAVFHPLALGAEIAAVFAFNWMLRSVCEKFRDEPALRETLEARLIEVLVDEIGHIAFNRIAVGPLGLAGARALAPWVAASTARNIPEFRSLGWSDATIRHFDRFDLHVLPDEVKRRSFFV
jgi:hypothetical protein